MSTLIRIKRSGTQGNPSVLGDGVLAYSAADYTSVAGGGRLYIGYGAETGGDAASHIVIGGQYFTDMLDHAKGTLTANSAIITNADSKIDILNVDNITINGNTISSTDVNGNIVLDPNGSGLISVSSARIVNLADPTSAQDAVTKNYLETGLADVYFKDISASGNLQIDGDLIVGGTTTTITAQNLSVSDNMIYLNEASSVAITDASGDGSIVTYTAPGHNFQIGMVVTVTGVTPSSYNVTSQTITGVSGDDFTIVSANTDTYVSGGTAFAKTSANPDLGIVGAYDDGTYAHAGIFRDATDGRFKFFDSYTPEPDVFIDTGDASFAYAEVEASTFYGALSGNATTATTLQSSRNISLGGDLSGSASFDGSADVTITATVSTEVIQDAIGSAISAGTQTNVTVTYVDGSDKIDFAVADATTTVKGVASFPTANFSVTSGAVSIIAIDGGTY